MEDRACLVRVEALMACWRTKFVVERSADSIGTLFWCLFKSWISEEWFSIDFLVFFKMKGTMWKSLPNFVAIQNYSAAMMICF